MMTKTPPSPGHRARGCLLGLAAGNILGLPTEFLGTAEAIRREFPEAVQDVIRQDTPESPYDDDLALALIQAEELLQPEIDFQRLALRWVEWKQRDGRGIGLWTRNALDHIATHHSPPAETGGIAGNGSIPRTIPVALATINSPANLVSGSYHLAHLLHPDPRCAWGAVAVNVAINWFLHGERDFIPEVLEALRTNGAPEELVAAVRRVPLEKKEELPVAGPHAGYVVNCVEIALWFAYHEARLERGLIWLANAGGDTDTNGAVAGALMGARDGEQAIPARWIEAIPDVARIRRIADRLVGSRRTESN
jgi:ADP-ribosyl-[dinitrogen reductase] hydrolase